MPFPHSHVDSLVDPACQRLRLAMRDLGEWRMADQRVTPPDLGYNRFWQRTSAGHITKKIGNTGVGVRRAVREQKDCRFHRTLPAAFAVYSCTNSRSAITFSTGVPGRIPCPRLKI